jgi:hypothetical protein
MRAVDSPMRAIRVTRWGGACVLSLAILSALSRAAELRDQHVDATSSPTDGLTADELAARIDQVLADDWRAQGISPAPAATDEEFVRRVHLDLIGRIPSVAETLAFLEDQRPDKRRRLVADLLERGACAAHFANTWRDLMLAGSANQETRDQSPGLETWLRLRFAVNMPYDQLVREVLTAPVRATAIERGEPSPAAFYQAAEFKPERLAASTSRVFFGVQLQCAECHDHPFAAWKREQFWSFAAFFKSVAPSNGATAAMTAADESDDIRIPGTQKIVGPRFLDGAAPAPQTGESNRLALARWAVSPSNPLFARAAVNRLWDHFYGRGLVYPVDDLDANNPSSHPALFDLVARQFVLHGHDLKYLIRAITATDAYGRSSRRDASDGSIASGDSALTDRQLLAFARLPLRRMTSDQLFASFVQATGFQPGAVTADVAPARDDFRARFGDTSVPRTETPTTILQSLAIMNGKYVAEATDLKQSKTLVAIIEAPYLTTQGRIDLLFLTALSRKPQQAELDQFAAYVADSHERGEAAALADIFWSLLNSAEFVLNH